MFGHFGELSLQDFIDRYRAPEDLWIFLHIPKTAGSSFCRELSETRAPYKNIHIDYTSPSANFRSQMDHAVQRFLEENADQSFRSCSGHMDVQHVDQIIDRYPRSRLITLLRDPLKRVISDFRYSRTPAHPPYKEVIARYPTINDYVQAPETQNKMYRRLVKNKNIQGDKLFDFMDRKYVFIGLVEMYPMSFNIIHRLFGKNDLPKIHARKTESTADNDVTITDDVRKIIIDSNCHDYAIYEHVKKRLWARREEWIEMRKSSQ